jgi:outer membrane receptor protein involved in Fe transport
LKYSINDKHALRLGVSKTYTLPQSKEISPYQYVNISFASEGNPKLKPSDNYNIDLKWDNYLSPSELISASVFYKRIVNPIGRVDKGNSAGLLTYDNISKFANLVGIEFELRKNLYSNKNTVKSNENKLSFGLNASYIYTNLKLKLTNTPERKSGLEGASPFILNTDITYSYTKNKSSLMTSLVLNYFSNRIYTIGTLGFKDIMEKGVPTLDFVASYKFNNNFSLKFKAANMLNPSFSLIRKSSISDDKIILNQYKKGVNLSLGVSFNL